jgi:hypothetical protein
MDKEMSKMKGAGRKFLFAVLCLALLSGIAFAACPAGMVSYWKGDSNTNDSIGANNGAWQGTAIYASGKVNQAFSFNGANYVQVPDSNSLDITDELTVCAWVNYTGSPFGTGTLDKQGGGGSGDSYMLDAYWITSVMKMRFYIRDSAGNYLGGNANTALSTNTWYFVCGTFNKSSRLVVEYLNGVSDYQQSTSGNPINVGTSPILIGRTVDYMGVSNLDELAVFNRTLSAGEINALYNLTKDGTKGYCDAAAAPPAPPGNCKLKLWYKFEESSGSVAVDEEGNDNGAIVGSYTREAGDSGNGNALRLNGGGWVNVPYSGPSDPVFGGDITEMTVEGWFKHTGGWYPFFFGYSSYSGGYRPGAIFGASDSNIWVGGFRAIDDTYAWIWQNTNNYNVMQNGVWVHLAVTFDGTYLKFYANGHLIGTNSDLAGKKLMNPELGQNAQVGTTHNNGVGGVVDEFRVYRRALTADEVMARYNKQEICDVQCGNGVVNASAGEQCDAGAQNGVPCTNPSGGSCQFCNSSCQWQTEPDGDGFIGALDNCPTVYNPGQEDTDGSGIGDACNSATDPDGDELENAYDNCDTVANPGQGDAEFSSTTVYKILSSTDTLPGGSISGATDRISGYDVQFSCGSCDVATFDDAMGDIGPGLCGYGSNVPKQIIYNNDLLCARDSLGNKYTIDLISHCGGSGCVGDSSRSGGYNSYERTSVVRGDGKGDACDCDNGDGFCTARTWCVSQGTADSDCGAPPNVIYNATGGTVEDQGITVTIPAGALGTTELLVDIVESVHSFAPTIGITNISQPLDIGPQCIDIEDESTCESTNGCRFNELGMCESIPFSSPVTITMPGDCTGAYGDLITQKIAKYNPSSGTPEPVSTCDPIGPVGGIWSCTEPDDRVMTWNTNTCKISVQVWSFSTYAVVIQVPVCGNGAVESGEECDMGDLNGQDCSTQGYVQGELVCTAECTFDASGCLCQLPAPPCSKSDGVCSGLEMQCMNGEWADCTEGDYQSNSQFYSITENTVDTCWDGEDNDCNGLADKDELGCLPGGLALQTCTVNDMIDFNGDGTVDSFDALIVLRSIISYPNQVAEPKDCQAIILGAA